LAIDTTKRRLDSISLARATPGSSATRRRKAPDTLAHLQAKRWYNTIKVAEIVAAAAVPVLVATGGDSFATKGWVAAFGALVVILEGVQQLRQYGKNPVMWGQSKEALKREYFLYTAGVRPYDGNDRERCKILAEKVESLIGGEVSQWAATLIPPTPRGDLLNPPPHPGIEVAETGPKAG
jgi:hypothetical protein